MAIEPNHIIWTRERKLHHAGAIRPWLKDRHDDGKLIGNHLFILTNCVILRLCRLVLA